MHDKIALDRKEWISTQEERTKMWHEKCKTTSHAKLLR